MTTPRSGDVTNPRSNHPAERFQPVIATDPNDMMVVCLPHDGSHATVMGDSGSWSYPLSTCPSWTVAGYPGDVIESPMASCCSP